MEECHPNISHQVEVMLNINDEAVNPDRANQLNNLPNQCTPNNLVVNAFKPNISLSDPQTNSRFDEATIAVKAAQAALKAAEAAVARLHIHDYLTQRAAVLQQHANHLYEEAADSLEQSKARLYQTSLEDIPILAFRTVCQFLNYKDTANLRLTSKTVLFLHRYTEDDRFQVCHLSVDVKTNFPQVDPHFLMHDFQLDINFIIEQKLHGNYAKITREYDVHFEKVNSFLFAHEDRIRRLSMDSYLCNKHVEAIMNLPKLQHLTLNKGLRMQYNYSDWDEPALHSILVKNAHYFKKIDVTGVDLKNIQDYKYPIKNLSHFTIGEHCINWEKFGSLILQESAANLTKLQLHATSRYTPTSDLTITNQLPKLTSLSLHDFDSNILCSILNQCCSSIKYLDIHGINIQPQAIPEMPRLEIINMSDVSWTQIALLAHKMPNVKEIEIGVRDPVAHSTPDRGGVVLSQLTVVKIWDKNHCAWIKFMWYYLFDVAPNLKYVHCRGAECIEQCRRLCQNFRKYNIIVCDLESDRTYTIDRFY